MTISIDVQSSVAAPSYDALITLVGTYLNRSDLNGSIPAFIELAHRRFNRTLFTEERHGTRNFIATGTTYSTSLDIYRIKGLFVTDDDDTPLDQVTLDELKRAYEETDRPRRYAYVGGTFYFDPQPDNVRFTLIYDANIPILSGNNQMNWLLAKHPDIYLYGALVQAEAFLENDARVQLWKSALDEALGEVLDADQRKRFSAGPLVMRVQP